MKIDFTLFTMNEDSKDDDDDDDDAVDKCAVCLHSFITIS